MRSAAGVDTPDTGRRSDMARAEGTDEERTTTVADVIVERLRAWGVERVFGYSGDGINGVIGALQRGGGLEFVQARHEEMAAFMATGHAKFTGSIGVCLSTQ